MEKRRIYTVKKQKKHRAFSAVVIGTAVLCACVLGPFFYVNNMLAKIHYAPAAGRKQSASSVPEGAKYHQDVLNVLLIGTDNRAAAAGSRSDTMILVSVNRETSKVVLTSFMRDSCLPIPGHGNNRLNAAYSFGGAALLMQTIQQNFKIQIDRYVQVNFSSFIAIIDSLGGIQMDVTEKELPACNQYVKELNSLQKSAAADGLLQHAGKGLTLTGKQALGYSRIRSVGGDYRRTERQRTVLMKILEKGKKQNPVQLNSTMNLLLPNITTNLTQSEVWSLVRSFPTLSKYKVVQDRIPIDGAYTEKVINGMDVLQIDFEKNCTELQGKIYG
ncbi:MAG: LCP family protein [Oscillospiraceae bacterium]|jgi:LCP family protein required for cell wall assembly|nr:LCP family protein [Oscillospiraceae bacterium]MDD3260370.1 LCP family protein [Oscillospiraceae bacterium]